MGAYQSEVGKQRLGGEKRPNKNICNKWIEIGIKMRKEIRGRKEKQGKWKKSNKKKGLSLKVREKRIDNEKKERKKELLKERKKGKKK